MLKGNKRTERQRYYIEKFGLPETERTLKTFRDNRLDRFRSFVYQLDNCADDEARRLILGVKCGS